MDATRPWINGAALAVTVGVVYIVCAIGVALFPDGTLTFFNTWAHGVDVTLAKRPATRPLAAGEWIFGFVSIVLSGYLVGALHGWTRNLLGSWK
ncbi:MAG TPA: DUF5676 family membrane protein [Burkholderiales bacterium]|jgi:hypothetical protein